VVCSPDPAVVEEVVSKLLTVCTSLHEYPYLRYNNNSYVGVLIAQRLQDALDVGQGATIHSLWGDL
jgi:hypothetical protein